MKRLARTQIKLTPKEDLKHDCGGLGQTYSHAQSLIISAILLLTSAASRARLSLSLSLFSPRSRSVCN